MGKFAKKTLKRKSPSRSVIKCEESRIAVLLIGGCRRCTSGDKVMTEKEFYGDDYSAPEGFDLAHCIALAGCSFEAYTDPVAITALAEKSANGTTTIYTDREFVKETFEGLLQIHLQGASKLPARDVRHPMLNTHRLTVLYVGIWNIRSLCEIERGRECGRK